MREVRRTSDAFSASGPTMKPGVSQSETMGRPNASQSCRKRAALSAHGRVDGAGEMHRVVGDEAERMTFDAHQRRDHAGREFRAQFEHGTRIGQRRDHLADVVDAQAVFRDQVAQCFLIGRVPFRNRTLEIGEIFLRGGDGLRFVLRPRCRRRRWVPAPTSGRLRRVCRRQGRRLRSSRGRPCRCLSSPWR